MFNRIVLMLFLALVAGLASAEAQTNLQCTTTNGKYTFFVTINGLNGTFNDGKKDYPIQVSTTDQTYSFTVRLDGNKCGNRDNAAEDTIVIYRSTTKFSRSIRSVSDCSYQAAEGYDTGECGKVQPPKF